MKAIISIYLLLLYIAYILHIYQTEEIGYLKNSRYVMIVSYIHI